MCSFLHDIYYLPKNSTKRTLFASYGENNNIIPVTDKVKHNFSIENNTLICSFCFKGGVFVNDTPVGILCPRCFFTYSKGRRKCNKCFKKLCCDTCGGKRSPMVEITEESKVITLCLTEQCLEHFGYSLFEHYLHEDCSCSYDIFLQETAHYLPDLRQIISEYINPNEIFNFKHRGEYQLEDRSLTDPNKCLLHQLKNKYISLMDVNKKYYHSDGFLCKCI